MILKTNPDLQERIEEQLLINFSEENCGHNCKHYTEVTIDRFNGNILFYIEQAKTHKDNIGRYMDRAIAYHNVNKILKNVIMIEEFKQYSLTHKIYNTLK